MPLDHCSGVLKVKLTHCRSNDKMVINWDCLGHNLYIYAWISKLFGTAVFLEK